MKRKESELDFLGTFYSQSHTIDTLVRDIDSLLSSHKDINVRLFPIYIDPLYWDNFKQGNDDFELLSENKGVFLFRYSFLIKEHDQRKKITGKFFIIENKEYQNIYSVISLENTLFFSKGILPYFSKAYPRMSLTFITHKRLKNLLVNFRDRNSFKDMTIVRTTTYSRVGRKIMPSVNWPEFSLEKAFEWVDDENGWFQNIMFRIRKPPSPKIEISISRKGVIKSNGYFKILYEYFITPISKTVYDNIKFLSKRSRLDNPNRDVNPLCINFGYNKFSEKEENQKLIEVMKAMKASSLSVLHANPYIHLSMFDYFDGSSFDIWVLNLDRIIIVPQLKSSFQSIRRLINHVFDNYAEGDINNFIAK